MSAVATTSAVVVKSAGTKRKGKELAACKQCNGNLKPWKDKGESEPKLTCVDCGWRIGDKVKKTAEKNTRQVRREKRAEENSGEVRSKEND